MMCVSLPPRLSLTLYVTLPDVLCVCLVSQGHLNMQHYIHSKTENNSLNKKKIKFE